ncbi:hypothetical protein VPH35_126190 [Triticum aestivum]
MASSLMSIPDHLKAEIFVRLPEPEDLARTAATCVAFRGVLADGSFRRRFRLLHAPPLLGILDRDGFHPALPPHPAASAARALAHAADFTFSFQPSHRRWAVQDVRDGRVLLAANPDPQVFTELVVCDPLHQRHILLPQVPHDLAASLEFPVHMVHRCQLLIASPGAGENEAAAAMEEAARAFIVVMIAHCETGPAAFVFSSSTRQWRAAASNGWDDLFPNQGESTMISSMHSKLVGCHYAYGCFYLESTMNNKLLVFDTWRMEFSILDVPCETSNMFGLAIVEAGEGRLGMLDIHDETLGGKCELCYYIRGNRGENSGQWKIEKTISLPYDYQYYIQASTKRYLLLRKLGPLQSISSSLEVEYVSMDVKTLQLQRVCGLASGRWRARGCARLEVVLVLLGFACSAAAGGRRLPRRRPQIVVNILFLPNGLVPDVACYPARPILAARKSLTLHISLPSTTTKKRLPISCPLGFPAAGCSSAGGQLLMATDKKGELLLTKIPDHPLTEILLRMPTPEDLARACAACSTFRRIATDGSFRRRFCRLHNPLLLGFVDREGFHPAVPPHPAAPAARALARTADFSFSFLPSDCSWTVRDIRDGRVLLARDPDTQQHDQLPVFTDLVPSLIPPNEEEAATVEDTTFRVIWFVPSNIKLYILVFSSSTRQWRAAASQGLTDLLVGEGELPMITLQHPLFLGHYYACGCVYWKWMTNERWKKLLILDTWRMEFSIADLPLETWNMADIAIVEAGEDRPGLFGTRDEFEGENLSHWQTEKTISLNYSYQHCIGAATGRYLLLEREEGSLFRCLGLDSPNMEYFSLDVETLHLERVCDKPISSGTSRTHLYTNFPPPLLSSPTI